jgi:predicted acylesterase/phospholipase RssA
LGGYRGAHFGVRRGVRNSEENISQGILINRTMKYIAIGPGGMAFFTLLGKLSSLQTEEVKEVSGSSAGALLASLWVACKGDTSTLLADCLEVDIISATRYDIKCLLGRYGLIPISNVYDLMECLFEKYTEMKNPTFAELYKWNPIKLHVSSLCIEKGDVVYFNVDSHPNMFVIDALAGSISIPLLFEPLRYDGRTYVDAAAVEQCPALPFVDKPRDEVLAIMIKGSALKETDSLFAYVYNIANCVMHHRYTYDVPKEHIDVEDVNCLNFNMSFDEKIDMYMRGNT